MLKISIWTHLLSGTLIASTLACSETPEGPGRNPDLGLLTGGALTSGGVITSTGGAGTTGGSNSGGSQIDSGGTTGTGGDTTTTGGSQVDPTKCGGDTVEPKTIEIEKEVTVETTTAQPIALFIMLDGSGSMDNDDGSGTGTSVWNGARNAISDFTNDPASTGVDVALGIFPPAFDWIDIFNLPDPCLGASYLPPNVPMGRLPNHAPTVMAGLPAQSPGGGTPIQGAILGATEFCKNFTPANPEDAGEECVVLFITDGRPSGCAIDTPTLVSSAQAAGVRVFTIALPGVTDLTLLNEIAAGTGTDCDPGGPNSTCDLTQGASFADALASIRDTIVTVETHTETQTQFAPLECEWGLPDPDPIKGFDEEEVNVILNGPTSKTAFANVTNEAACGSAANAWFYDNADAPTRILACPNACDVIKAAESSTVEIQLGCPIIVLE